MVRAFPKKWLPLLLITLVAAIAAEGAVDAGPAPTAVKSVQIAILPADADAEEDSGILVLSCQENSGVPGIEDSAVVSSRAAIAGSFLRPAEVRNFLQSNRAPPVRRWS